MINITFDWVSAVLGTAPVCVAAACDRIPE